MEDMIYKDRWNEVENKIAAILGEKEAKELIEAIKESVAHDAVQAYREDLVRMAEDKKR